MSKFKVGDRVRVKDRYLDFCDQRPSAQGTIVKLNDSGCLVSFDNWSNGHNGGKLLEDASGWNLGFDDLDPARAAKFQVLWVEEDDETFDTQEEAEKRAAEYATNEVGFRYGVFKLVAVTSVPAVTVERF